MKTLLFMLVAALPLNAAPAWLQQVNIPKKGPLRQMPATKLSYTMTWNGKVKAGNFDLIFGKKDPKYPKHYLVHAYGGSTGWAHALYPFQFNYISFLRPKSMRPMMFTGTEKTRAEVDTLAYRFTKRGVTGKETDVEGGVTTVKTSDFKYPNALDLFSGLLQIRSMPLKNGDTVVMPFHPVSKPYLAKIKVLGREKHRGRKCIKLSIGLQKIGDNMKLKHYKKLKSSTVWLSDDGWRVPMEIRAKVFVGSVRVLLTDQKVL